MIDDDKYDGVIFEPQQSYIPTPQLSFSAQEDELANSQSSFASESFTSSVSGANVHDEPASSEFSDQDN